MKKISYLIIGCAVAFTACKNNDSGFTKAGEGVEYKIISEGKGETLKPGEFVEFNALTTLSRETGKDSVLSNTRESGATQILQYDSTGLPPVYFKIFAKLKNGDSLVTRLVVDSIFKGEGAQMPPFMKKGHTLTTMIKVVNIYKTREQADSVRKAGFMAQAEAAKAKAEAQIKQDQATLLEYFTKNKIYPVKTPQGAFVEIIQQGTGPVMDTTNFARIKYTGRLLNGTMFDSNNDPSKPNKELLTANLTSDYTVGFRVIDGMADGLRMLSKGAKAKIYIPSPLGYGVMGAGNDIPANSILIFEVEVADVWNKSQAAAEKAIADKKMDELRARFNDSVGKLQQQQPAQPR